MTESHSFPRFTETLERHKSRAGGIDYLEMARELAVKDKRQVWQNEMLQRYEPLVSPILSQFAASLGKYQIRIKPWQLGYLGWEIHSFPVVVTVTVMASLNNKGVWPALKLRELRRAKAPLLLVELTGHDFLSEPERLAYLEQASWMCLELSQTMVQPVVMRLSKGDCDSYTHLLQELRLLSSQVKLNTRWYSSESYAIFSYWLG